MRDVHPLVAFCYFVAVIALTMSAYHPIIGSFSVLAAVLYLLMLKGARAMLRLLGLALIITVVMLVAQVLTVHLGKTVLFQIGKTHYTLESFLAGLSMATMLVAVIFWFSCYQEAVGSDRFMAVFSRVLPTSAMMVSMVFSYVPGVINKSQQINDAHKAIAPENPGSTPRGLIARLRWPVRLSSILMGWSMETGLTTAASMRARGYGAKRRTSYLPLFWSFRDYVMTAILLVLIVLATIAVVVLAKGFTFYPGLSSLGSVWQYTPIVALFFFPLIYEGGVRLKWRLSSF